jgi:hypothetical protein
MEYPLQNFANAKLYCVCQHYEVWRFPAGLIWMEDRDVAVAVVRH